MNRGLDRIATCLMIHSPKNRGMEITSNVSKNALLQIFNQLPPTRSNESSLPENSTSSVTQNLVNDSVTLDTQINNNLSQENSNYVTSLGIMAAMQKTITSLQCTMNKLKLVRLKELMVILSTLC